MEQQDRNEVLAEAQKIVDSSMKLDETVEQVEAMERKKQKKSEKKQKKIDGLYTEACKARNLDPETLTKSSKKKTKKQEEVIDKEFIQESESDLDEIEEQVKEKISENKKIPEKKLGYRRSKHVSFLDLILIALIVGLVLFICGRFMAFGNGSLSLPDAITQRSVLAYINTSQPYAYEKDILMQIEHAEYNEEDEILTLEFAVTNNNDDLIRFLSSSLEIVSEDLTVTPILAGSINETEETPASGIKKGETMKFSTSYAIDPKDLAGRIITLKGLFLNSKGTVPLEVKIPELLQVR
mgnify:FL=1